MNTLLTTSNITFTLGIIAIIFSVFNYFKTPQTELDKKLAVDKEESEGKSTIMEERAKWDRENTDNKFKEISVRMSEALALAQNHTHTVDVKVDKLIESTNSLSIEVAKLATIVEERMPKKF